MVTLKKLFFILIIFSTTVFSTTDIVEIQAFLSKESTPINEPVQLTIEIFYKDPTQKIKVELPELNKNFRILSRSKLSSKIKNNNELEIKDSFQFQLLALREGNISIPAIRIKHNNNETLTDALYLSVERAVDKPKQPEISQLRLIEPSETNDMILDASISTTNIYIGQHITYKLILYRKRNYWNTLNVSFPSFEKAWTSDLDKSEKEYITNKNEKRYYAYDIIHKSISPLEVGVYTIPSASISFSESPFSPVQKLSSKVVTLNVKKLPENRPKEFKNAVGDFTISSTIERETLLANTPNTLRIIIQGDGNLEQINHVNFEVEKNISTFQSSASTEFNSKTKKFERVLEYILVPENKGVITVKNINLSYFSPKDKQYASTSTQDITFNVLTNVTNLLTDTTQEQKPPPTSFIKPYKISTPTRNNPLLILLGLSTLHLSQLGILLIKWLKSTKNPNHTHQLEIKKIAYQFTKILHENKHHTESYYQNKLIQFLEITCKAPLKSSTHKQLEKILHRSLSKETVNKVIIVIQSLEDSAFNVNKKTDYTYIKQQIISILNLIKKELT